MEDIEDFYTTFGSLSDYRKQKNRLDALRQSIIYDVKKISGDAEITLPVHKWNNEIRIFNKELQKIGLIEKISGDVISIRSKNEIYRMQLADADTDILVELLAHLQNYAVEKYLNYPDCCIEHFYRGGSANAHDVNWNGFIPCGKHKDLSLAEVTELLGRNPTDDEEFYFLTREPRPVDVYDDESDRFLLSVEDNFDGTFTGYVNVLDEDGDIEGAIFNCICFTKKEAIIKIKEFAENFREN